MFKLNKLALKLFTIFKNNIFHQNQKNVDLIFATNYLPRRLRLNSNNYLPQNLYNFDFISPKLILVYRRPLIIN